MRRLVVLGAGPSGLGAASQLRKRDLADVTVVDRAARVGGLAGSFDVGGMTVDFGSHRLHPACDPNVLRDLDGLLDGDLLLRERRGRIRLAGRWLSFPLRPLDMARNLSPRVAGGALRDGLGRVGRRSSSAGDSFAAVMERGVGRTLCNEFYFPYARKVWGLDPRDISPVQATRRVAARSTAGLIRKAFASAPIVGNRRTAGFYYPRHGYGQISERLAEKAASLGAHIELNTAIEELRLPDGGPAVLTLRRDEHVWQIEADQVWSTIPVSALVNALCPKAPDAVLEAAKSLRSRAMVLVYLILNVDRFSPYDTHYFPQEDIPFSRVSEPKNFSGEGPSQRTVLCAELPTEVGSELWAMTEAALEETVVAGFAMAGLFVPAASIAGSTVIRLPSAYPIYAKGFEHAFGVVDDWVSGLDRVVTFGRQGLFAHNNLHHVLEMSYAASDCLDRDGRFDRERWAKFRTAFDKQVVVD